MGRKRDTFADRFWDGMDDAFGSFSPERLADSLDSALSSLSKKTESDYEDYRPAPWGWQKTLFILGIWTGGMIFLGGLVRLLDRFGVPTCPTLLTPCLLIFLIALKLFPWARDKWDVLK